jgi:hypothetical protein
MRPLGRHIYYLIGISVIVMLIADAKIVMPVLADESKLAPNGRA